VGNKSAHQNEIKTKFRDTNVRMWTGCIWLRTETSEHIYEFSAAIKGVEFLD
jgi:hypothetical protein